MVERDWTEIFEVEQVREPLNVEVGDCNQNCLEARELKCVCKCHGKNHGAALKQNVKSLDEFEKSIVGSCRGTNETVEDPAEQAFSSEEYREELAVLC